MLCRFIQGVVLHADWAAAYGVKDAALSRETLPVAQRLALVEPAEWTGLPPVRRTPGTCRDFALMLCSLLRGHGVAARVRREGRIEADAFGHGAAKGAWFLRVNLMRDLLSLNKQETSEWDAWRSSTSESRLLGDRSLAVCDRIAAATRQAGPSPPRLEAEAPPWMNLA